MTTKKLLLFLAFASLALFADPTGTVTLDIEHGEITFTSEGVSGYDSDDNPVTGEYAEYIITGENSNFEDCVIRVESGAHNITFSNLIIDGTRSAPFKVSSGASVTLTLVGENELIVGSSANDAALNVPSGATLTIQGEGSLIARAYNPEYGPLGARSAGIGGRQNESSGDIIIKGGNIEAYGDTGCAGIGGATCGVGNVTIIGGTVYAESTDGAGIGSGRGATGAGAVTIKGGIITGISETGAGIGSGENASDTSTVTIEDGFIEAKSTEGAAIGFGKGAAGSGAVVIKGGTIAPTSETGAAIGSGENAADTGTVTIEGGTIEAVTECGAAIGSGKSATNAGTVTITGGTIKAESGTGAGVGAGEDAVGPNIYISGGSVKAQSTGGGDNVGRGFGNSSCPDPRTGVDGECVYLATVREAFADQGNSYLFTMYRSGSDYPYTYFGSGYTADNDNNLYFYLPCKVFFGDDYDVRGSNGRYFWGRIRDGEEGELILYFCENLILNIADGPIYFDLDANKAYQYTDPYDPDKKTTICASDNYIIKGTYAPDYEDDQRPRFGIVVTSILTIKSNKITLENCNISAASAFRLEENASVELILKGVNNTLRSSSDAGIFVSSGAKLTICAESTASLFAYGGKHSDDDEFDDEFDDEIIGRNYKAGAGIGGYHEEEPGEMIINGGTITAEGAKGAAGIGGGYGKSALVRYLTINGGNITAIGHHGAGIGGGQGSICDLTIKGGNIIASSDDGAGIGSGKDSTYDGKVIITGGTIKATSTDGSGIGGGNGGTIPDIYISSGSVWASSIDQARTREGGETVYQATLQNAMVEPETSGYHIMGVSEEVTFTTKKNGSAYDYSYTGTGYSDSNDLYFYLPDGSYVIEGSNGRSTGGTISGGSATFVVLPEPTSLAALALLALAVFLRRK